MDYEKKYKEALERAKEKYAMFEGMKQGDVLEDIFPELKKSKDERIRKAIIEFFELQDDNTTYSFVPKKDIIAWLEKQGKQKLADKVEPKFHKGEWITNGDYTWKIVEVKPLDYILQSQDGNIVDDTISHVDEQFHSFAIEDAKDGDVLVIQKTGVTYESIFIFNKIKNHHIIQYLHYFITDAGEEVCEAKSVGGFLGFVGTNIYPATKEQRNLLFQKMKEAGYEWDAEKKELKKIEEEFNGEDYGIDSLYHAQMILEKTLGKVDGYQSDDGILEHKCAITAIKKLYKQKLAWSEEDEERIKNILSVLGVQVCWNGATGKKRNPYQKEIDWLKSLRPRNTWKPSKGQLECLGYAIEKAEKDWPPLINNRIYLTLKALKEQLEKI